MNLQRWSRITNSTLAYELKNCASSKASEKNNRLKGRSNDKVTDGFLSSNCLLKQILVHPNFMVVIDQRFYDFTIHI